MAGPQAGGGSQHSDELEQRGCRERPTRWLPWLLLALAVAYVAVLWANPLGAPTYTPDSESYIQFQTDRTAGYPLFLDVVTAVFGTVEVAPDLQLLLASAAFAFLGWSIERAFRAPRLALLVALSLFCNPEIARLHPAIMTESLFVSLLCVMMGTMAMLIVRPTPNLAALSALACGVAIALRPAAISLVFVWPMLAWFIWARCASRRFSLAAAIVVLLALVGLAESVVWHASHPGRTARESLANMHLFAKALMMEPVPAIEGDDLHRFLNMAREKVAPARDFALGAPDWQTRLLLLTRYEAAGQRQWLRDEVAALSTQRDVSFNRLLGDVGWMAIAVAPTAWANNGLRHYVGLWGLYELLSPAASRRYSAYVHSPAEIPFFETGQIKTVRPPHAAAWPARLVMGVAFLATVLSIGVAVVRRWQAPGASIDSRLILAASCGFLVHGHYLLVALFGIALARYSLAMWPLLVLCGFLLVDYVMRWWASRALV